MISFSTILSSDDRALILNERPANNLYNREARIARAQTLDGGVVVDHRGYVDGDQNIEFNCETTEAEELILKEIFENETLIYCSTKDGFYSGCIKRLSSFDGNSKILFWIKEAV